MGYRIEIQLSCDGRKRLIAAYQLFRLVDFQLEIGLVNALARLCLEEGTKVSLSVVHLRANLVKGELVIHLRGEEIDDFVL